MILERLAHWAGNAPDRTFVVTLDDSYSYGETWLAVRRFAAKLRAAGVGRGDHVALIAGNSAGYLVAWFAINAVGAVAVCLNNQLFGESINYLVTQSDAKLIIGDEAWLADKAGDLIGEAAGLPRIRLDDDGSLFKAPSDAVMAEVDTVDPSELCTILYTSGTTGLPKGVMCAHGGYAATGRETVRILGLSAEDRILVFLPLFHTNPQMYAVMSALTVGASLALSERFSASSFFDTARKLRATGCTFVGTVLAILAARFSEPARDHGLRFAIGGGTTKELAERVEERFGIGVVELYGMTEIGGWVSGASIAERRVGANGRVRADMEVAIFDGSDNPVPAGQRGEIVVRPLQPNVILKGYYRKSDEFLKASTNFWFHTGDAGSFDADGFLYFHGRLKEVIRRGGEMISPDEIEGHIRKMPCVRDCAVVGVPDPIMGDEIKVVLVADPVTTVGDVRDHLSGFVPKYMLPRYLEMVAAIPRTQTEKILRRDLQYINDNVVDFNQDGRTER